MRGVAWVILFPAGFSIYSAVAQVVLLPHGKYENDFQTYLVAVISLALLGFAVWRHYRRGR
jgi:hypothetical protein